MPQDTESRLTKLELEFEKLRTGQRPTGRAASACSNCCNVHTHCEMSVPPQPVEP
jgi:hypothetical protein